MSPQRPSNQPAVPLADPKRGYRVLKQEIDDAVRKVLDSGSYILGEEVSAFEREFATYIGVQRAIGVGSGTDALHLALRTSDIGPGDAVITASHTAVATVAAIELTGATPILVDIDPDTFTMDPSRLKLAIAAHSNVRAVIPVHLYGHPADMPAIMSVAGDRSLIVIEDCAQAHGASIGGRKTGSWGHMAAFSFYPTKNIGALGDGGALVTNDDALAERAELLRQYGWHTRYVSDIAGLNSRLDEIQAAILRIKLRNLDRENSKRQELASIYDAAFSSRNLCIPIVRPDVRHAYHQYTLQLPERDQCRDRLEVNGIQTAILYPKPVHLQPAYRDRLQSGPGLLRHSERICTEILSIPMHPYLTENEIVRVVNAVISATQ